MGCQKWGWRKVDSLQPEVYLKHSVTSWPGITISRGSLHGRSIKGLQRSRVRKVSVYYIALMEGHTIGTDLLRSELKLGPVVTAKLSRLPPIQTPKGMSPPLTLSPVS